MAINFPAAPAAGDIYPPGAGTVGVSQWQYDGSKWNTVPVFVRTNNQLAYNSYIWPNAQAPEPGYQLTDLAADSTLSWEKPGGPFIYLDDISSQFDGATVNFTLTEGGVPFTIDTGENIIVVLGGIVQTPGMSYTIAGSQITFSLAPAAGAAFAAITNLACIP